MFSRCRLWLKYYQTRRTWNINVNILVADVLSTGATSVIIEAIHDQFGTPLAVVVVTVALDGAISLVLFASLHWYANRHRGWKDLAQLQVHRWLLAPLNYVIGGGIQYALLASGLRASLGVLVAYWGTLAVVRTVHTLYLKRSGSLR